MAGRPRIAITHDGCTWNQAEVVLPVLKHFGIQASFFADAPNLLERLPIWRASGMPILNGSLLSSPPNVKREIMVDELADMESLLTESNLQTGSKIAALPFGIRSAPDLDYTFRVYSRNSGLELNKIYSIPAWDTSPMELLSSVTEWSHEFHIWGFGDVGAGDHAVDLATYRNLISAVMEEAEFVTLPEIVALFS